MLLDEFCYVILSKRYVRKRYIISLSVLNCTNLFSSCCVFYSQVWPHLSLPLTIPKRNSDSVAEPFYWLAMRSSSATLTTYFAFHCIIMFQQNTVVNAPYFLPTLFPLLCSVWGFSNVARIFGSILDDEDADEGRVRLDVHKIMF